MSCSANNIDEQSISRFARYKNFLKTIHLPKFSHALILGLYAPNLEHKICRALSAGFSHVPIQTTKSHSPEYCSWGSETREEHRGKEGIYSRRVELAKIIPLPQLGNALWSFETVSNISHWPWSNACWFQVSRHFHKCHSLININLWTLSLRDRK